jgi:hypothetical protein
MSPISPASASQSRHAVASNTRFVLILVLGLAVSACSTTLPEQAEAWDVVAVTHATAADTNAALDGQTVSGTIVVTTASQDWMQSVKYHLNGLEIGHAAASPFSISIDTTLLPDGDHSLVVEPLMASGRSRSETTVSFAVNNAEPTDSESELPVTELAPGSSVSVLSRTGSSLRGDPSFSRGRLSSAQRAHYDRVWADITGHRSKRTAAALSDDVFVYARDLASHIQAVLIVFRMTGDLALLDHVDEIAQLMRSKLADGWRGTNDGTNGTKDGYLNWVFRPGHRSDKNSGKDTRIIDEIGTHANVAAIAYALEANRDLKSPTGRNYAANADFWKDYLVNHFEAKWRARRGKARGFPIMSNGSTVTYFKWIRWHYYMGELTGVSAYTAEASRMADIFWNHMYPISTPSGTAYVWASGIKALKGANSDLLNATTYLGHFYGNSVEFHLEGFHNWSSDENMRRLARTFTEFIIDTNDPLKNGMASDVGGRQDRLHLKPDLSRTRLSLSQYRDRNYVFIAPWDATGQVARLNASVQARYPTSDTIRVAAGLLFASAR